MKYECIGVYSFDEITPTQLTQFDMVEVDGDFQEVRVFKEIDDLKEILGEVI